MLEAIQATAARHERNRALRVLEIDSNDWQALFRALIEAESAYRPNATSAKGAYGLGQLMAATARDLGVDRTDIAQNLDGSARYLLAQLASFNDIDLALAAYNAGPHRVVEHGGVPPFTETRDYIARVHRIRARLSGETTQDLTGPTTRVATRPDVVFDLN
ncbi:lytic transglycosylase domain-containing protein [Roseobacter sp. A03A-229]